ncbi:hypothetical protein V8017_05595 [Stenotrophomonas rhizophila]
MNQRNGEDAYTRSVVKSVVQMSYVAVLRDGLCVLRVNDSSRISGAFIALLSRAVGFGFSSKLLQGAPILGKESRVFEEFDSYRLVGLKLSDVVASSNVVARLEFASKYGMQPSDIPMIPSSGYKVSMAKYDVVRAGVSGTVSYFASGRFSVTGRLQDWLIGFIQERLIDYGLE